MATTSSFPYSYIRKKICKTEEATISIQCKAIQYGLGVFSGIRGNYNSKKKNLYLFRMEDHYQRLVEAAKITGMKFGYSYTEFKKVIIDLVRENNIKENIYIRPTIYAASTKLTPRFDNDDDDLAVYIIALKNYFDTKKGLNVCISSWRRFDDDSISTKAKITGGYVNSALAKTEAIQNGFDEALFLNRDGKICEASGANIFGIKNGKVYTPPLSSNNLGGITRKSLFEIFQKELKLTVNEENVDRSILYAFDELFLTGTAAKITWISKVDKRKIGNGEEGNITKKIKKIFDEITSGENRKYSKWLTPAY